MKSKEDTMGKNILIVVDMQNDFVTGSLANPAAEAIIPNIKKKIDKYLANGDIVIFTRDTHRANYLETAEGKNLPVPHCIHGTPGWCVVDQLNHPECRHVDKPTFGFNLWEHFIGSEYNVESIELCGTCTDICVVSNALLLKAFLPEMTIKVDSACCAGVTHEKHAAALETMRSCQIFVK
jgi:nicotinamidase-related amidase